jgi:diguanylate cyclase (GGDEF)-like protein
MIDSVTPTPDFDTRVRRTCVPIYAVAIASTLLVANLPFNLPAIDLLLNLSDTNRWALNLITLPALLSLVAVWFFPWHRFHRLLFLTMTVSGTILVALAVAFSGGWHSTLRVFYVLVILFNAAYYPRRLALLLDYGIVLCSLSPALYQPELSSFIAHVVIFGPACLCVGYVSDLMMSEVRRREREVGTLVAQRERRERELARLAALHRAGTAVSAQLDSQRVIETVVHELGVSLGYSLVGIYLREGNAMHLRAQMGFPAPVEHIPCDAGVVGRVFRSGRAALVADVQADPDYLPAHLTVCSEICVPILDGHAVIGVVNVESESRLDRGDLELLELFAQQVSAALANAQAHAAMTETARRDPLTGVLNHGALLAAIEFEIVAATAADTALAVLFLDLDYFKEMNDRHGHAFGDEALRTCSHLIEESVAPAGIVGRYGGDEFVVILPAADHECGLLVAERVRARIAAHVFRASDDTEGDQITASIGVAAMPEQATTASGLLGLADRAVYTAKSQGRDRVSAVKEWRQ